jgi:2-polyprenyl-3-methyl-5-hydroxy-6-metoxy-1,4-benzoquinol methylase
VNRDYSQLINSWERQFITRLNFSDKTVLDYGIGAAYLGKYLLEQKNISHYYGLDISDRSISKAKNLLRSFNSNKYDLILVDDHDTIIDEKIDVVICQQVIQHFVSEEMLLQFLNRLCSFDAKLLMLQTIQPTNSKNLQIVDNNQYDNIDAVVRACRVTSDYIISKLPMYCVSCKYHETARFGDVSCFNIYEKV